MDYKPTLKEVEALAGQGNMISIYRELAADLETPVSVYLKLQDEGPGFLLESISGGEAVARYSFIGVRPHSVLTALSERVVVARNGSRHILTLEDGQGPLDKLKAEMADIHFIPNPDLPRFPGGAVGYLSYDCVRHFESLPATNPDDLGIPEAVFMFTEAMVAFDHARQRLLIIANIPLDGDLRQSYRRGAARIDEIIARLQAPLPRPSFNNRQETASGNQHTFQPQSNFSQPEFEAMVNKAKQYIVAGDIFQVVLSQRLHGQTHAGAFDIYRALRSLNPSPYMVFMRFPGSLGADDLHIIAASPEMHVRLEEGTAELRPIAGTRPRGKDQDEDMSLAEQLLRDEKERAEHIMLVDLGRNDLGRVCEYGSIRVPQMMEIERYSHVMHLVSQIRGRLKGGMDAFDLLRATFPAGTVSGAPKVRAMQIIEEQEPVRRGIYAGVIGYFGYDGNMDSCIAIRTMLMKGQSVYIQAGGGIVADSQPVKEYEESLNKARALSESVRLAEMEVNHDLIN